MPRKHAKKSKNVANQAVQESNTDTYIAVDDKHKVIKPAYDGRLQYFDVIKLYMQNIANSQCLGDFITWHRLLNGLLAVTKGYADSDDIIKVKAQLYTIQINLGRFSADAQLDSTNKSLLITMIDRQLQDATELLYEITKHLYLPISDGGLNGEYDIDTFMDGSNL